MSEHIIVIGDVHGHLGNLEQVFDSYGDSIDGAVLVGDVVSGGPESRKTVEFCRQIGATIMLGNNEWDMLGATGHLDLGERDQMQRLWLGAGGYNKRQSLLESYGVLGYQGPVSVCERLGAALYDSGHADYLLKSPLYVERPDFIAVHAGLNDLNWEAQRFSLDLAQTNVKHGDFLQPPIQITSHDLARDPSQSAATDKVVVTGHAHNLSGDVNTRITAGGKRVRLATLHWQGEPLLVWESWTGALVSFTN